MVGTWPSSALGSRRMAGAMAAVAVMAGAAAPRADARAPARTIDALPRAVTSGHEARLTTSPDAASLGDGAWSWFADPRALRHGGRTYVGWVAADGDVKVASYDHASLTRTTAVLRPGLQEDDHANPALQILPDGRVRVFYSAHTGSRLHYRTSLRAGDITAWTPEEAIPGNTRGPYGYTYPNPIHLAAENRTYLFWRGGNYNPTFSTLPDAASDSSAEWAPPRTLISVARARPYVKYASDGGDTIHMAYTNAHPNASADVNIHYAAYRGGAIERADGTRIGTLGTTVAPRSGDVVFDDPTANAWVHDVAHDSARRPVIVFAVFRSLRDHRYMYARWNGAAWEVREITAAGGSISPNGREPYYSGGITLDHEDPSVVYLSRQAGDAWEVETWRTADGGVSWTSQAITAESGTKNVRPVSPRGLIPFSDDLSVVWMRGVYASYVDYRTSITTLIRTAGNAPPIADAESTPRSGSSPQVIAFDGRSSRDPDGAPAGWEWDFGDGSGASGAEVRHTYERAGRYFPTLTVTDAAGARDVWVGRW